MIDDAARIAKLESDVAALSAAVAVQTSEMGGHKDQCDDASGENGYADNDELDSSNMTQTSSDESCQVSWDGTNIYIAQGATFNAMDKSTFNVASFTTTKWKWVIRAWA